MIIEKPYTPINCGIYDYLEIACMHAYDVALELHDGSNLQGKALTLRIEQSIEVLVIQTDNEAQPVRLDSIEKLKVLSSPRQFDDIQFN